MRKCFAVAGSLAFLMALANKEVTGWENSCYALNSILTRGGFAS
ncbi:hypothetical protein [Dongia sp.]|jgi:hypothetical protein